MKIIKRFRDSKYVHKTEPDQKIQPSQLRDSMGQKAKQHLRQISQLNYVNHEFFKNLDWAATMQNFRENNKQRSQKGCFEINLSQIKIKPITANQYRIAKPTKQVKILINQPEKIYHRPTKANKASKRINTCGSINYIIGDSEKHNQSRIHSIKQNNIQKKDSYFMIDEETFKTAALKIHSHFQNMQSPKISNKKSHTRIQSELMVHKKRIEKISSSTEPIERKDPRYIYTSPKKKINYSIPLADSMLQIQKRRINTSAKASFILNYKPEKGTL